MLRTVPGTQSVLSKTSFDHSFFPEGKNETKQLPAPVSLGPSAPPARVSPKCPASVRSVLSGDFFPDPPLPRKECPGTTGPWWSDAKPVPGPLRPHLDQPGLRAWGTGWPSRTLSSTSPPKILIWTPSQSCYQHLTGSLCQPTLCLRPYS